MEWEIRREENWRKQGSRGGTLGNPFATGEIEKIIKIDEIERLEYY